MGCDLPAELAADGAAASGDQHCFAIDEVEDFLHVRLDGFAAEKVLYGDLLHLADCYIAAHELVHAGQVLELAVSLLADVQDVSALLRSGTGNGQIDLLNLELLDIYQNAVPAAYDRHAIDVAPPLVGLIVDEAHYFVIDLSRSADVTGDCLTCIAGAYDHDPSVSLRVGLLVAEQQNKAIRKADRGHKDELQRRSHYIIGNRHAAEEKRDKQDVEHRCYYSRHNDIQKFCIAGVFPDALIKPRPPEYDEAAYSVNRCKACPGLQIRRIDRREFQVIAKPKSRDVGEIDDRQIIQNKEQGNVVPMPR